MFDNQGIKTLTRVQQKYRDEKSKTLLTSGISEIKYDTQELQDLITNISYYLIPSRPLDLLHQRGCITPLFGLEQILRRYKYHKKINEETSSRKIVELGFGNFFVGKSQMLISHSGVIINYRNIMGGNKINTTLGLVEKCKIKSKLGEYYERLINISPLLVI